MHEHPVRIVGERTLADDYYPLRKFAYEQRRRDGSVRTEEREVYASADGATALLYDPERRTVLLTRQFRIGAHVSGHHGYLFETAAGVLDGADPAERVRAEIREETGYEVEQVKHVMTLFASPGVCTERVHYFVARYSPEQRRDAGGGKEDEGEDIEVVELGYDDVLARLARGEIEDVKTVVLLQYLQLHLMGRGA